ncbi:hypothetical protein B0H13DRAFT_1894510 [Mycena leptocephala]|nr:hypothetical protein B0H13DRAFT_1894510 [Mycena leptocephala]
MLAGGENEVEPKLRPTTICQLIQIVGPRVESHPQFSAEGEGAASAANKKGIQEQVQWPDVSALSADAQLISNGSNTWVDTDLLILISTMHLSSEGYPSLCVNFRIAMISPWKSDSP